MLLDGTAAARGRALAVVMPGAQLAVGRAGLRVAGKLARQARAGAAVQCGVQHVAHLSLQAAAA